MRQYRIAGKLKEHRKSDDNIKEGSRTENKEKNKMLKKMNEQEKRQVNGGSISMLITVGMTIAGLFADGV